MPPVLPLHPSLQNLNIQSHTFLLPEKKIHSQTDLDDFVSSLAYIRVTNFLKHLNAAISPVAVSTLLQQQSSSADGDNSFRKPSITPDHFYTNSPSIEVTPPVQGILNLITELEHIVTECPPNTGPRRFGNAAFRTWHKVAEERIPHLLDKHLPADIVSLSSANGVSAKAELRSYLMGSFGSAQRLDYGTGHELSFLAFLCGIWLLGGFSYGRDEQALALRVLSAYLHLIRTLVKTYTLEPAGSHGVWGLDDHSFLPYIFGSAQLTTEEVKPGREPDYAGAGIPRPGDVAKANVVDAWRVKNLYFEAIGFIYDVKKGPFWEHSPILYDISGVKEGWGKINIGMLKMYWAEVLGKFPVVQHFHFGSLFPWTSGGDAPSTSTSTSSTQLHSAAPTSHDPASISSTRAPWAKAGSLPHLNQAPMPTPPSLSGLIPGDDRASSQADHPAPGVQQLRDPVDTPAPWKAERRGPPPLPPSAPGAASAAVDSGVITKAPWAK